MGEVRQIGELVREDAWADINPPAMASARQVAQHSESSGLIPATRTEFRNELTACLALVAPVGMTEEARGEWLSVAWQTVKELPADILASSARKARETCDHPAKIVPTIMRESEEWMAMRRRMARYDDPKPEPLPQPGGERCTAEDAEAILRELRASPSSEGHKG